MGLPPDFVTNGGELGLDVDARPALAEVLDALSTRARRGSADAQSHNAR